MLFDEPKGSRYFMNCPRCEVYILKTAGEHIKCRNCGYTGKEEINEGE